MIVYGDICDIGQDFGCVVVVLFEVEQIFGCVDEFSGIFV